MQARQVITALAVLLIFTMTAGTWAEPRGWGLGVGVFDSDFGLHARKDFVFGEQQQFEAVLQGGLYNQNKWTGRFDADFHYLFRPASAFRLYPLIGIDWALQNKSNRAGVNLGGGCMLDLNTETRLFIEGKYVAGDWDGYALTVGLYF
ncbi:MAG: hypothetical protein ACO20W_06240 [Anaerohalosphaeraceae bacterium]